MKTLININSEPLSRKYINNSNFRNSKRIRWSEYRTFGH